MSATRPSIEAPPAANAAFGPNRDLRPSGVSRSSTWVSSFMAYSLRSASSAARSLLRAGGGRGVGPRGGVHHDPGEVVDPDHEDQRDPEHLERLGLLGRGQQQEGQLLEDLEADGAEHGAGQERTTRGVGLGEEREEREEEQHVRAEAEHDRQQRHHRLQLVAELRPLEQVGRETAHQAGHGHAHEQREPDQAERHEVAQLADHEVRLLPLRAARTPRSAPRAWRTASRARRTGRRPGR